MTAAVPGFLIEVAQWVTALGVIITFAGLVGKFRLTRWVFRNLLGDPFDDWVVSRVRAGTEDIREMAEDSRHRIRYHLGSNDTTKPTHARLSRIEQELGIPPVPQQREPDLYHGDGSPVVHDEEGE